MADEHDKWLDRDAAERLLRGEPLEAATEDDARRAERLSAAFDALTVLPAGPDGELPGEDAALKAFREARAVSAVDAAVHETAASVVIAGRHGAGERPRRSRSMRFGLAAALAACMVGGVGVAAGTGMMRSPFGGSGDPTPASSVSGGVTDPDERPLVSPPPRGKDKGEVLPDGSTTPDPSGSPGIGAGDTARKEPPGTSAPATPGDGKDTAGGNRDDDRMSDRLRRVTDACRRYRDGDLSADERRRLRGSAKQYGRSSADIGRFCDRVLDPSGDSEYSGGKDGAPNGTNGSNGSNGPKGYYGPNQSGDSQGAGGSDSSYGLSGPHQHGGGQDADEDDDPDPDPASGHHRRGGGSGPRDGRPHGQGDHRGDRAGDRDRDRKTYRETGSDQRRSDQRKKVAHQV